MLHVFPAYVLIQQCNKKISLPLVSNLKVYGVDWSCNRQLDQFLSASWDHSIKLVSIGLLSSNTGMNCVNSTLNCYINQN